MEWFLAELGGYWTENQALIQVSFFALMHYVTLSKSLMFSEALLLYCFKGCLALTWHYCSDINEG